MPPTKNKSVDEPREDNNNNDDTTKNLEKVEKKNKKGLVVPPSKFEKTMATDVTVPRCIYIQTDLPLALQPIQNGDHNAAHFTFEAAFLTAYHLYAFYKWPSEGARIRLGRLCRFSHAWQAVDFFPVFPPSNTSQQQRTLSNERLHALPLPWAQGASGREVMLFYGEHCARLMLWPIRDPRIGGACSPMATLEQFSLRSMISLPEEAIDGNGEMEIDNVTMKEPAAASQLSWIHWIQVIAEPERRAVLALAELSVCDTLGLFRLDLASRKWTRLALVEDRSSGHRLTAGHFMALLDGHLYIGQVRRRVMESPQGYLEDDDSLALEEVLIINLESLVVERRPVTGRPSRATANLQANLQFAQVGDTVYALSALLGPVPNDPTDRLGVVKNQLWALHLPSLTMQHINDGPQEGLLPSGQLGKSSTEKSSISSFSFAPEDYFVPSPSPPSSPPWAKIADDDDTDLISDYEPFWPSLPNPTISIASPMLMTKYVLVADGDDISSRELWALSLNQVLWPLQQNPPPPPLPYCRLYRVVLGSEAVPRLPSMTILSMLTSGRPVDPPTAATRCSGNRPMPLQEQYLPYLRAFIQRHPHLGAIAQRHLHNEEHVEVLLEQLRLLKQELYEKLDEPYRLMLQE